MVSSNLASRIKKNYNRIILFTFFFSGVIGLNFLLNYNETNRSTLTHKVIEEFVPTNQTITVSTGDTFLDIVSNLGIDKKLIYPLIHSIKSKFSVNNLQVNKQLKFVISDKSGNKIKYGGKPENIVLYVDDLVIKGSLNETGNFFHFTKSKQKTTVKTRFIEGYIGDNLYSNILSSGATKYVASEYVRLLKNEVDFRKDLRKDTKFRILFKITENQFGTPLSNGEILYSSLSTGKKVYNLYKFKNKLHDDYFLEDGNVVEKTFFTRPIPGARITSGYGYRIHPISGRRKFHRGIDFSAKKGTPIRASASGKIEKKSFGRGYGRFIVIKHNAKFSTLYAHMHNFHRNMQIGSYVKKGDIIGYVGNTGLSTAPHLHYEIRQNNVPINPRALNMRSSDPLKGKNLVAFTDQKKKINSIIENKSKIILASKKLPNNLAK